MAALPPPPPGPPSWPDGAPRHFRATVHGTLFSKREVALARVQAGDALVLIADPHLQEEPQVWVHLASGDPLGHLPQEIGVWLAPWMQAGGAARARALQVAGPDTPSWRRLLVEVACAG
jgi:hypothetical protein